MERMVWRATGAFLISAALHAQTVPGLLGEFSDGARRAAFIAAAPNFYLDAAESIHPALNPDFRGRWTGFLRVLENGAYEFSHEVSLNGTAGRRHTLAPGGHRFELNYERPAGAAGLRLQWRTAAFEWEPVPPAAWSHHKAAEAGLEAERGRMLVFDARCSNCHQHSGTSRPVPALGAIGSRTNVRWLYNWLERHQPIPHTPEQSADLAAHLATLRSPSQPRARRANEVAIGKGGELFGTLGCVHCHALSGMGSKYTLSALVDHLLTGHEPSMLLNEGEAIALAAYLTRSADAGKPAPPGDAARGAAAFTSLGCAGCHGARSPAPPLRALRSDACRLVRIAWNEADRAAVRAFLNGPPDRGPAPVYEFPYRLREHACLGCHRPDTEAPPLEGVGEKLKTSWIGEVMWGKRRIRPGRELRMPHFAEAAIRPWIASFARVEGLAPGDGMAPPASSAEQRTDGIGRLGTNARKRGMSCIGCHDWGANKSIGEEGPQLIDAAARLRFEWFERWMRNPARILSGTSMPNYFSGAARGGAQPVIHALWAGLELGAKAPVPDGYRTSDLAAASEAKPVPGKDAVVVRWDMPGATPAAIAVGLPGGLSYCFDAGESRVLYAWSGGFLDLTGTLLRKTDEKKLTPTAALAGEVFWRGAEFPIRVGAARRIPQRRFKGYRLMDGAPEFHYQVDGIDVYEKLTPVAGERAIRRDLTFRAVDRPMFFEGRPVPRGLSVRIQARIAP